ncbi:MAG: Na/Pi cotransporter family protein [Clostridiales bacterium]|nr:Na/Pi cotransporter family protein [Clostridiales bacterium]
MSISQIIGLFSGVALFLYGMSLMGDGLKQLSGNKLGPILFSLSSTQIKGVLFGTAVTAVIQSSCATAVMTVGFVNSGLMKLRQAISVILGAILGTSITGWVICLGYLEGTEGIASLLSTSTLTGIVAVTGILLRMFGKRRTLVCIGNIMMGFAILMFGMSTMSSSVSSLGKEPWFLDALTGMSNPLIGILVGAAFTALLQSASAAVGIVQALSVTGAMTTESALPLLLGISVGASFPVLLSALGANVSGKRTAMVYLVASAMSMAAVAAIFYIINAVYPFSFMTLTMDPFSIATLNTLMRMAMVLSMLPLTDVIEGLVTFMVRDKQEDVQTIHLEERFLAHPAVALEQSRLTIDDMARLTARSISSALELLTNFTEEGFSKVEAMESEADQYEDQLGTYLMKLTATNLSEPQSREVSKYLHVLSDFERITDHALNLAQSAKERVEKQVLFSETAQEELHVITSAVTKVVSMTVSSFTTDNMEDAKHIEPLEETIDNLCDEMKMHHVQRLQQGTCTILQGFIFNDLLTNFERISDHCSNVAVAMIELNAGSFETHDYIDHLKERSATMFQEDLKKYESLYALPASDKA